MSDKAERVIHLLRALAIRADGMLAVGSTAGYEAMGRMFNEYMEQVQRSDATGGLISPADTMDLPDDESEAGSFLGELALRASQTAAELEFGMRERGADTGKDRVDWADAIIRLSNAGVDTDELVQRFAKLGGSIGSVDCRWVDRITKLAEAGVDVDELLANMPLRGGMGHGWRHFAVPQGGPHMAPGGPPVPPPPHASGAEWHGRRGRRPRRRPVMHCQPGGWGPGRGPGRYDAPDSQEDTWRIEVLSRVEKGDITPDEAVGLLRQGPPGQTTEAVKEDDE